MQLTEYDNRQVAANAAGKRLANALYRQLGEQSEAALIVSGGSTPAPVLSYLSHKDLDWHRVTVSLSDERWVSRDHPDSNAGMLDRHLFRSRAAFAKFQPLYLDNETAESSIAALNASIAGMPTPYAGVLLGMGTDGHFASLFPDADNLTDGLSMDQDCRCIAVKTAASDHARISLTLAALTRVDEILLLVSGNEKRAVIDAAMKPGSTLPVAALLNQQQAPVRVIWSP